MRILYIQLAGFKRMMLNQVELFSMTMTERIQLILGTNGSGKSSLMNELSPLPADPKDFTKEGRKEIHISHLGRMYILKSDFTQKQAHSFEVDGEELNPGGTITVQRDLVEEHFHINNEVRQLLLGEEKFHKMGPSRRREWFTRLSDTSYDYALRVYSKIKEEGRDATALVRNAKQRLVTETAKIITMDEQERLKKEVDALHHELMELRAQSAPIEHNMDDLRRRQESGMAELNALSTRLLRQRFEAPVPVYGAEEPHRNDWGELEAPKFTTVEEIETYLSGLKNRIAAEEALLNASVKNHGELSKTLEVLKKAGAEGIQSLQAKVKGFQDKRNELLAQRKLKLEGFDPQLALKAFDGCREVLTEVLSQIPPNESKKYSQQAIQDYTERQQKARRAKEELQRKIANLTGKLQHMEQHKSNGETQCPKCDHRWNPGFSAAAEKDFKLQLDDATTAMKQVEAELGNCDTMLAELAAYAGLYRQFTTTARGYPVLQPFWDYLIENKMVIEAPRQALMELTALRRDLDLEYQAWQTEEEIREVRKLILQAENVGDASLTDTQRKLDELTHHIEGMTLHLSRLRQRHAEHVEYRRELMEAINIGQRIEKMAADLEHLTAQMVDTAWRETIAHCIRQTSSQLAKKEEALNAVTQQQRIVAELQQQLDHYTVQHEAAKILLETLSPTEGLIAEGLMGFIRNHVRHMNNFIKKIWTYPLKIKECGVSSEQGVELDYKFPIIVKSEDNRKNDVSEGSSAMKDVIDLAFQAISAKFMGLAEAPLYLDEFGNRFDDEHRFAAVNAIKQLLDSTPITQLFMVSHYESSYSAFTQAEICVLDKSNITLPSEMKYNHHVTID